MIRIRNRLSGVVLLTVEARSLAGCNLRAARLEGANLRRMDLRGADLSGADLASTDLNGTCLAGAGLQGACLRYAELRGADLSNADLSGANLSHTDLSGAHLPNADLTGVDLSSTLLVGVNLTGARLNAVTLPIGGLCQLLEQRKSSRVPVAHTLIHLADHHPTLRLRHALPVLRRFSGLLSLEPPANRQVLREAVARIETALAALGSLPVPAGLPPSEGELPRPAAEPEPGPSV